METAIWIAGALVILGALIGFVRSIWRPPGRGSDRGEGTIEGVGDMGHGGGGHDGGGH
jgi:hypothetical protein